MDDLTRKQFLAALDRASEGIELTGDNLAGLKRSIDESVKVQRGILAALVEITGQLARIR